MATGNMLLGQSRGKVGSLVFYRRNGKQVTRSLATSVSNPNTEGQAIQRMIFGTVQEAYQRLQPIVNHSFESVKYGAQSQAKFFSINLKRLRGAYITDSDPDAPLYNAKAFKAKGLTDADSGTGLVIAQGSIAEVPIITDAQSGQLKAFGSVISIDGIDKVIEALGAVTGDQITICGLCSKPNTTDVYFDRSRYVINSDATPEQLAYPWVANGVSDAFDSTRTKISNIRIAAVNEQPDIYIKPMTANGDLIVSCAIIISRKSESGKWLRSNAVMYNFLDEHPMYAADYALPTWMAGTTQIETTSDRYLNNAE